MKTWLLALLLCGLSGSAFAQDNRSVNDYVKSQPKQSDLGFVLSNLGRCDTIAKPAGGHTIRRFYASGRLGQEIDIDKLVKPELEGKVRRWYENGQLHSVQQFVHGEREDTLITFHQNGRKSRVEKYLHGVLQSGVCYSVAGKAMPCGPYQQAPEYAGGLAKLMLAMQTRTTYPPEALRNQVEGKVFVSFVINAAGQLERARVVKGIHPLLDEEALRVVNTLRGWQPAYLDGVKSAFEFTVPVTFRIE